MKILIVDDARDVRAWLKAVLQDGGCEVFQAEDGRSACHILESTDIQVVITDWMMPRMDGIELIRWIRNRGARDYVYTILMTSRDQEADYVAGLCEGADDFLAKPVSPTVLRARLTVARRILAIQQELLEQQEQLRRSRELTRRAYASVQQDLAGASAVQRSQLPGNGLLADGIETAWLYRPAMGVSGDYLDIHRFGPDRLAFYLLDVSGHGVSAALRSATISQMLRPMSGLLSGLQEHGPAHVVERLNRQLCEENVEFDYLATLVYGELDLCLGRLRFVSAGHPPPLMLSPSAGVRAIAGGGIPLGIDADARYDNLQQKLEPGDTMLMYSDGLPDCENPAGERWGLEGLKSAADGTSGQAPARLLDHLEAVVNDWRAGADIVDDISALALRYRGPGLRTGARFRGEEA